MYESNTILTLKDPKTIEVGGEEQPFPYNRVRVVAASPINHGAVYASEWTGTAGQGVIIEPLTSFGATAEYPLGQIQALYDVESIPEQYLPTAQQVKVVTPATLGDSPEEALAKAMRVAEQEKSAQAQPNDPLAAVTGNRRRRKPTGGSAATQEEREVAVAVANVDPTEGEWVGNEPDPDNTNE